MVGSLSKIMHSAETTTCEYDAYEMTEKISGRKMMHWKMMEKISRCLIPCESVTESKLRVSVDNHYYNKTNYNDQPVSD